MKSDCSTYGSVELLSWAVASNLTSKDAESWPQVGVEDLDSTIPYNGTVFITKPLFDLSMRTQTTWSHSEQTRADYGYAMYGFFAIVFFISTTARAVNYFSELRRVHHSLKSTSASSAWRAASLVTKRYLTTPALFTYHTAEPVGWCSVPRRIQSLTIFAFFVINLVLCCVSYETFTGNLYWADTNTQLWRYLSDRTGVIAISNMPLMFAFAMRNNILMWFTGWDFATFNMFHRWVARIATIEAVIHSIGYTVESFLDGGKAEYVEEWSERYWWMGAIATIVMCFLCGASILPIRKLFYEIFLLVHIVLAVIFLVGMWYHVEIFDGEYNPFIWPCVAVWAFDRLLRIFRISYINYPSFAAKAVYNTEANVVRVTIPVRTGFKHKPQPGTHYYLYGLQSWKPWESHPFTLSSWEPSLTNKGQVNLTFIIRPYDSFTRRLRTRLIAAQSATSEVKQTTPLRLAIEGSYGHPHTLASYNSILMIIGGSGITVALSHLQALHEALQQSVLPIHQVHLVWAVRDEAFYNDVHKNELATWLTASPLGVKSQFKIDVHVTRNHIEEGVVKVRTNSMDISSPVEVLKALEADGPPASKEISDMEITKAKDMGKAASTNSSSSEEGVSRVTVVNQRPNIHNLVMNAAETWCTRGERLVVVCCGPAGLADDTRAAVVAAYARGYEGVDLVSESFNW